jgi:hypothetical protein
LSDEPIRDRRIVGKHVGPSNVSRRERAGSLFPPQYSSGDAGLAPHLTVFLSGHGGDDERKWGEQQPTPQRLLGAPQLFGSPHKEGEMESWFLTEWEDVKLFLTRLHRVLLSPLKSVTSHVP